MTRLHACYLTRTHALKTFNIKYSFGNNVGPTLSLVIYHRTTVKYNTVVFHKDIFGVALSIINRNLTMQSSYNQKIRAENSRMKTLASS